MNIDTFQFKVANGIDKPAIWFMLHDREVMIFPYELYNILFDCSRERWICREVKAHFQFFSDEVCGYYNDTSYGSYHRTYQRSVFIESAIQSLKDLSNAVIRCEQTEYNNFNVHAAEQMRVGLKALVIPKNYSQLFEDDIREEPFSFEFVEPYSCDTNYVIGIGEKRHESSLSDWTTDFNLIRLEIERFVLSYYTDSDIKLYFDDSPSIIRLRNISLHHSGNRATKVTIIPNGFIKEPNTYGWCEPHQLIAALYLGLLGICIKETDWFDDGYSGSWDDFRLATYNKLQSCVIENYLKEIEEDEHSYLPRQRVINSVEEMLVDYQNLQKQLPARLEYL